MNHFFKIILTSLMTAVSASVYAAPACPLPFRHIQPDGSTITLKTIGDEFSSQTFTVDGLPVVLNASTGAYDYAIIKDGAIAPSGIAASDAVKRTVAQRKFIAAADFEAVRETFSQHAVGERARRDSLLTQIHSSKPMKIGSADITNCKISEFPTVGKVKTLVILVQFSNLKFRGDNARELWNRKLNGVNYTEDAATGSAADFYRQGSDNKFNPEFVVAGPVTLSQGYDYYGSNGGNSGDDYSRIGQFVSEACLLAEKEIDYSQFDLDKDGKIDNVYFIYAGNGEADSHRPEVIWPHSWNYSIIRAQNYWLPELKFGDKTVDRYTMSQEINGMDNRVVGIGTFIHEFGHVLGLADHYATDYSSLGAGRWDYMSTGCYNNNQNTPPTPSAFERVQLGWLELTPLDPASKESFDLPALSSNFAYSVSLPGKNEEGFILEYRRAAGWDRYLPGHGLLVWHLDLDRNAWLSNSLNNTPDHQRLDIVEADGSMDDNGGDGGDVFPGTTDTKKYVFRTWDGHCGFELENIVLNSEYISLKLNDSKFRISSPEAITVDMVRGKSADVSWTPVSNAENYTLIVSDGKATKTYPSISATSFSVSDLTPETKYELSLCANVNYISSDQIKSSFTTTGESFGDNSIKVLPATDVKESSFTANWEEVPAAENYYVTLIRRADNGQKSTSCDFTGGASSLPANWASTSGMYDKTTFGNAAPSLCLYKDRQNFTIKARGQEYLDSISMWVKVTSRMDNCTVSAVDADGNSRDIASLTYFDQPYNVDLPLDNAMSVSLKWNKSNVKGEIYIDDVTLFYKSLRDEAVEGLKDVPAGANLSHKFENLQPGTLYAYNVYAVQRTMKTLVSENMEVRTLASGGASVEDIITEDDVAPVVYDINGRLVPDLDSAPKGIYIVRRGSKVSKIVK